MGDTKFHYKFEDLKPVRASDIVGGLDPNDEYYPRQKVDAAICELDAHRLCFDTDRKYYMKVAEDRMKRLMSCENKLFNSNYRRCRYNVKECHKSLLQWQAACKDVAASSKALEKATEKVALWQKWEKRWEELACHFKPWLAEEAK